MRIPSDQLPHLLSKGLPPVLLMCGEEPLLIEESCDHVRRLARENGYDERVRMNAESGFDWNQLRDQSQSLSLFAERKFLELRVPSARPGVAGAQALIDYCGGGFSETLLIVITGKLDARARQSKWVKAIDSCGAVIDHYAVVSERMPAWIRNRLRSRGMSAGDETLQLLSYYLEGNLLAASQEIDKLRLLCRDGRVTAEHVRATIADYARFNVYALVDACLAGETERVPRILESLRGEGVEPVLANWALAREVRLLAKLAGGLARGNARAGLFKSYNIWSRRQGLVNAALTRRGHTGWWRLLRDVARVDRVVKGRESGDPWLELERVCLRLCGVDAVRRARGVEV